MNIVVVDVEKIQVETKKQQKMLFRKGIMVVFFALLMNMACGNIMIWGNLTDYMTVRFGSQQKANMLFPFSAIAMGVGSIFSTQIQKKIGNKWMFFIFGSAMTGSLIACSFIDNFTAFALIYTVGYSLSIGFAFVNTIVCVYAYFPQKTGIAGGVILSGFTSGPFMFGLISNAVINPNQLTNIQSLSADPNLEYRISLFFWILASFFFVSFFLGIAFVVYPEKKEEEMLNLNPTENIQLMKQNENEENDNYTDTKNENKTTTCASIPQTNPAVVGKNTYNKYECQSYTQALSSLAFYQYMLIPLFQAFYGQYILSQYKPFAIKYIAEGTLSIIGSFSLIGNALGRIFWGIVFDKYSFKKVYLSSTSMQIVVSLLIPFFVDNAAVYGLFVCLSLLCMSNLTSVLPPQTVKVFGRKVGPSLIGYTYLTFNCSNIISFGFTMGNVPIGIGCWAGCGLTVLCFVNGLFLKDKYVWNQI